MTLLTSSSVQANNFTVRYFQTDKLNYGLVVINCVQNKSSKTGTWI